VLAGIVSAKEVKMRITKIEIVNGQAVDVAPTERELEVARLFDQADALFRQGNSKDATAVMRKMVERFTNLPKGE